MATYTFYKRMFVLLFTLHGFVISFSQESIIKVPINRQIDLSSQIVEGTVIAKESFWDEGHNHIYTKQTIKVHKVFKGQHLDTVEIITIGGVVDLEAEVVSHSLQLREGDLGVFMLKEKDLGLASKGMINKTFEAVSGIQGFYKYDLRMDKVANHFTTISNIENNFYNDLENYTKLKFTEVSPLVDNTKTSSSKTATSYFKSSLVPVITSFSNNTVTAGTKSTITINGSGFGATKGNVGFSDANYGGSIYYDALVNQVISWSDNEIQVEIPDRAGTGTIRVVTSANEAIESSQNLIINFAQINLQFGNEAYQTQHVGKNGVGGYTWVMNENFYSSEANQTFIRAFQSWTCNTGVNWDISSSTTTTGTNANDGVNVISFDDSMSGGTLGQCYSYYSGCYDNDQIKWYVTEMDIVFNPNKNWNFSTNLPANDEVDFETVTLHELGHGHQLGHVINTNEVMHYSVSSGKSLRNLSTEDLNGAIDIQARSTATTVCSQSLMTQSSCYLASLSTDDLTSFENNITIFPNPTNENFYIKNSSNYSLDAISIYNVLGKQVYQSSAIENRNGSNTISIDTSKYTKGMYLVKLESELGTTTKKVLIN